MPSMRRPNGSQPGDDRLMMENPGFWPGRPVLPLKRKPAQRGDMPDTGVLFEDVAADGTYLRFAEGLLGLLKLEDLLEAPVTTVDKLLADGWVVD